MLNQDSPKDKNYGAGKFHHVALVLQKIPEPGQFSIQWKVESSNYADDARQRVEQMANNEMRGYVIDHPEYGFVATITEVISDPDRSNDYERETLIALRRALEDMGLPVVPLYAPPLPWLFHRWFEKEYTNLKEHVSLENASLTFHENEDAAYLDIVTDTKSARVTLSDVGACDMEVLETETGRQIFWKKYTLSNWEVAQPTIEAFIKGILVA